MPHCFNQKFYLSAMFCSFQPLHYNCRARRWIETREQRGHTPNRQYKRIAYAMNKLVTMPDIASWCIGRPVTPNVFFYYYCVASLFVLVLFYNK